MAIVREIRCSVTGQKYQNQKDWWLVRLGSRQACISRFAGEAVPRLKNWHAVSDIELGFLLIRAWALGVPPAKEFKK